MNGIATLALKDLRLLWRDKWALFWVFAFPLIYALFFGAMMGGGGGPRGRISLAVIDQDQSATSKALAEKLGKHASIALRTAESYKLAELDEAAAANLVRRGNLAAYVVLKPGFGKSLLNFAGGAQSLSLGMDPARQAEAGMLQGVLMETTYMLMGQQFADPAAMKQKIRETLPLLDADKDMGALPKAVLKQFLGSLDEFMGKMDPKAIGQVGPFAAARIESVAVVGDQARPRSSLEITFPSSVLWGVLGCMTGFAVSIVVERRQGTMLRLRIAPISRGQVLVGKGTACFVACVAAASALLVIGRFALGVRLGNVAHLAAGIACTAFCFVGIMMFLAVLGRTESAVAGSASAAMIVMAMLGGGMIPLFVMPDWMQTVSNVSPVKWGILALEGAIWRQFSTAEMLKPCGVLIAIGAVFNAIGVWRLTHAD